MNWVGTGPNQYPDTVSQPFANFPKAANYASLPTVAIVVPNLEHDMHNNYCGAPPCPKTVARADNWMHDNLDSLQQWALAHNTLFILTYDEDDDYHNNNIPVIFLGPMVKGGMYDQKVNHFSLLRTIEDMYGLGYAGASANSSDITGCWLGNDK
jgi:acid phosphatase